MNHPLDPVPTIPAGHIFLSNTQPEVKPVIPKSIFASKTVWGIVFTAVAAIAPIVGNDIDAQKFSAKDAAQIVVILCGAAAAVTGRVQAGPIYTPDFMPGPNRSSFEASD